MTSDVPLSPLPLLQASLKTVSAVTAPVEAVPLLGFGPLHPPDAVQPSASGAFHDKVALCPDSIATGLAVKLISTAAAGPAINSKLAAARTRRNTAERSRDSERGVDFKVVLRSSIIGEIRRSGLYMRADLAPSVPKSPTTWGFLSLAGRFSYVFAETHASASQSRSRRRGF
jgi:hypothetical protein